MKTVFKFEEGIDKRKMILYHRKGIVVRREKRKNHLDWKDMSGTPIEFADYIILRVPKYLIISLKSIKLDRSMKDCTGYHTVETENYTEILFYDRITFGWKIELLVKADILKKVVQRVIPDRSEGEIFRIYINARGFRQLSYNAFALSVEGFISLMKKTFKNNDIEEQV